MATETIEEFLARGGKVQKSNKETSLNELLFNEGLLDKDEATKVNLALADNLAKKLDKEFNTKK